MQPHLDMITYKHPHGNLYARITFMKLKCNRDLLSSDVEETKVFQLHQLFLLLLGYQYLRRY